jgi:hypothetical protein
MWNKPPRTRQRLSSMKSSRPEKRLVSVDEPGPFATLATWEQHLAELKSLPADTLLKPQMIAHAEETIAEKKREPNPSS